MRLLLALGLLLGFPLLSSAKVNSAGIHIAGCEGNMGIDGATEYEFCPTKVGPQQMRHFVRDDFLNTFRLSVSWQFLVDYKLGGPLDPRFMDKYDGLMRSCLSLGARCIIDIHNYARWNGQIIGQSSGGPTDEDFISLWTQLAIKYQQNENVIFGIMNEPYSLNLTRWVETVQKTVTAIRQAGATKQWILLPGSNFAAASEFYKPHGSGDLLHYVTNPDGSTVGLFFEVHTYYNADGSGQSPECVTNDIDYAFRPLAKWLRKRGRLAFLAETGGGNTQSCVKYVCEALDYLNLNSDVYLGWIGFAAGSFERTHVLSETPKGKKDTLLVRECIAGRYIYGDD